MVRQECARLAAVGNRKGDGNSDSAENELITATRAARLLDVHRSTITRWVQKGRLIPTNIPHRPGADSYLFTQGAIDAARRDTPRPGAGPGEA